MTISESQVASLARASRRTALLTLFSFVLVATAMLYSAYRLHAMQKVVSEKLEEVEELERALDEKEEQLRAVDAQLEVSRFDLIRLEESLARSREAAEFVRRGINHYQRGEFSAAVAAYHRSLEIDSANFVVYDWMGYAYYRNEQLAEALDALRRSVQLSPSYARGYYNLALALWRSGAREAAIDTLATAVELAPDLRDVIRGDGQFAPFHQSEAFTALIAGN